MPYSPFARFLAIVLVVIVAVGLLWPDDRTYLWIGYSSGVLAMIAGVFTWSVVQSAAPFNDSAFHRCLPPGDGRVFFRVIWIHLLVLAGISLAVIAYCVVANFGWRAASLGIATFTLPAAAVMSAVGVASSAATSRLHWKSLAWFAIFATPAFSWAAVYLAREGLDPLDKTRVYFTPVRTVVLTAAGIYPLIWWLIAARRRRDLGLCLGAATGALLPWLYVYGDFVKVPDNRADYVRPATGITVVRKAPPEGSGQWIPVTDLLSINGVPDQDGVDVTLSVQPTPTDRRYMRFGGLHDGDQHPSQLGLYHNADFLNDNGQPVWGPAASLKAIKPQLPQLETLEMWEPSRRLIGPLSLWDLSYPLQADALPVEWKKDPQISKEAFWSMTWKAWVGPPRHMKLLGTCLASEEIHFRLETGGRLEVLPLSRKADGTYQIPVRQYQENLWLADGPWFGDRDAELRRAWSNISLVLVDESGKHGKLVEWLGYDGGEKVMLGQRYQWSHKLGCPVTPEEIKKVEAYRNWRVYIFVAEGIGSVTELELPPP